MNEFMIIALIAGSIYAVLHYFLRVKGKYHIKYLKYVELKQTKSARRMVGFAQYFMYMAIYCLISYLIDIYTDGYMKLVMGGITIAVLLFMFINFGWVNMWLQDSKVKKG